jgi:hypothetical protein
MKGQREVALLLRLTLPPLLLLLLLHRAALLHLNGCTVWVHGCLLSALVAGGGCGGLVCCTRTPPLP